MIWNDAVIRYRALFAVVAVAIASALLHNAYHSSPHNKLSLVTRATADCIGPVKDAMPGLDNAATAIAPALMAGAGYVRHTREVSHKQIDAALEYLTSEPEEVRPSAGLRGGQLNSPSN